jgi:serine/threonine protein kinase
MHFKREISTSVSDLHINTVSDSIKRLAISHDGHPQAMNANPMKLEIRHPGILTVMSSAQDDFNSKYEVLGEIGRGGFSTVYQCRAKSTGVNYAVKVGLSASCSA